MFSCAPNSFAASDEEIQALKQQVQQLMQRIEKLESEQVKVKDAGPAGVAPRVELSNALSKLKMKGRFATGYYKSQNAGSFPSGSFEMPDAKIQFSFQPDEINTVVMRFKLDNGVTSISTTSPLLDYFYLVCFYEQDGLTIILLIVIFVLIYVISAKVGNFKRKALRGSPLLRG